ncbi:MAG: MmgE/PrpD family protein [Acidimicrobiia bacterium]|nr:MmgE/PrpD family protein [Acidimicrobiia bacterium]
MTVTSDLCQRIVETGSADIGPAAMGAARRLVLDGLAVAVAGAREDAVGILADHHRSQGSRPAATVLGLDFKVGTVPAAALNGAAMHVLDFEPMWSPANHALSTTLPAVLALAEVTEASGADVLTALVKGTDVQGWARHASRQWQAEDLAFHPPGVVGPIGAAVAAGHLLGLDAPALRHAVGIAASRSGGLLANVGTMTKATHCGEAAASGLEAALLAARGFTAHPDIFDAPRGLADAFFPQGVVADLLRFGPPFRVVEPGYVIKLFPCQFGTHFGITAALSVHDQVREPGLITAARLTTPVMSYVDRPNPATGMAGKFSLQYTVAAALLDGSVGRSTFTDERVRQPDVQALLPKIELTMSPDIPGRFEDMHVLLEVDTAEGRAIRERCDGPPGTWGSAPISDADHLGKVRDCLGGALSDEDVERFVDLADRFDELPSDGVRQLIELAGRARPSLPEARGL